MSECTLCTQVPATKTRVIKCTHVPATQARVSECTHVPASTSNYIICHVSLVHYYTFSHKFAQLGTKLNINIGLHTTGT